MLLLPHSSIAGLRSLAALARTEVALCSLAGVSGSTIVAQPSFTSLPGVTIIGGLGPGTDTVDRYSNLGWHRRRVDAPTRSCRYLHTLGEAFLHDGEGATVALIHRPLIPPGQL
jgi:hypothetical protein